MADEAELDVREVVGHGGFGTVYRAILRRPGGFTKEVAVKVLHERWAANREIGARLRDEARVLALVGHRAIPSVEGVFWVSGRPALVTEFVRGVTLTALRHRERLPVTVALAVCEEIANALHHALVTVGPDGRPLAVIHRDIKPSNIQVTPRGEVKLLDFGVARADFDDREAETDDALLGSLSYMSPERLDLEHGPPGDIWALGVVLAEVLIGRRPERVSSATERRRQFLDGLPAELAGHHPPEAVAAVVPLVARLLAEAPADRPTAREVERLCRELRTTLRGPVLAEWAEHAVERARTTAPPREDGAATLTGQRLSVRRQGATPHPAARETSPAPVPPSVRRPPSDDSSAIRRRSRAAPAALLLGFVGAAALAGLVVGMVALSAGTWFAASSPEPGPDEAAPPSEPAPSEVAASPESPAPPAPAAPVAPDAPAPAPTRSPSPEEPAPVTPVAVAPVPRPAPAKPAPGTSAPGTSAPRGVVSGASFATFVEAHPEWAKEAAIAAGRAGNGYLAGWKDGRPPAGAAVQVSWSAAEAYCAPRGGLAPLDAEPRTWTEGDGPFQEWRAGPGPSWRRFDGITSSAARRTDANAFTGFRCAGG